MSFSPRPSANCHGCGMLYDIISHGGDPTYCVHCNVHRGQQIARAHRLVRKAVQNGLLPMAKNFRCADCDKQAVAYEHRNYLYPLQVEPICHACNLRRGPGLTEYPYRRWLEDCSVADLANYERFYIPDLIPEPEAPDCAATALMAAA